MSLRPLRPALLTALLLALAAPSFADIYKSTNPDGTVSYTDSPVEDDVLLILRESQTEGGRGRARAATRSQARASAPAVLPVSGVVTSGFGWRSDPFNKLPRHHGGIDIAVPETTPVKAIEAARVAFSGYRAGYGNVVVLDHDNGVRTLYAHNTLNCVCEGQSVGAGEVIALSGATGRTTGPHLHFEVWNQGLNVTESYLAGEALPKTGTPLAHDRDIVRRILLADGSVLFTNVDQP